jgi:CheY-like chemotaxis protein
MFGELAGHATILVLDDDPALRELFGIMIERIGCRAIIFGNSAQAIDACEAAGTRAPAFDCALIDLNIDEQLDGVAVARILREINPRVRLVLVSGSINPKALEAHLQLGFDAVLPKPFSLRQLRETVLP